MAEIRQLCREDFDAWVEIVARAYPGWKIVSPEDKERVKGRLIEGHEQDPASALYGLFRNGQLLGGMRLIDFQMNLLGTQILAGGVGLVAVDLAHKKEHVAKEMVAYFLRHYRERGAPLALLYPFRLDFYKQMGFGYSNQMSQYRVHPAALPLGPSRAHVRYLGEGDRQAILACYNRFAQRTHGMIQRSDWDMRRLMQSPNIVGYVQGDEVLGYLAFGFEYGETFLLNDIHVHELVYDNREALSELLAFLRVQADQVRHIIFDTQDETFYFLLHDPRNASAAIIPSVYHESSRQGVGLMVRVIDTVAAFRALAARDFGGQTCALKLTIADGFLPENAGSLLLRFDNGKLNLANDGTHDVEVQLDVAEFSSLLVGAVRFSKLYEYGLADLSDTAYVETVDCIFAAEKPVCMTAF